MAVWATGVWEDCVWEADVWDGLPTCTDPGAGSSQTASPSYPGRFLRMGRRRALLSLLFLILVG